MHNGNIFLLGIMIDGKIIRGGMKMKKWKLATIAGTLLISFTLGSMAVLADTNVVTEQDGVKVFVGAVSWFLGNR